MLIRVAKVVWGDVTSDYKAHGVKHPLQYFEIYATLLCPFRTASQAVSTYCNKMWVPRRLRCVCGITDSGLFLAEKPGKMCICK